ncbi:MAG: uridine diphosphate-N-acetylglucosamine-binding protein YvcK [Candidatus Omnitrophica bacterium]|nr:uridine diphosphate-N-acetylglucosamine-binding protein YvcK [Candidatus Omnitrophota bacterium]
MTKKRVLVYSDRKGRQVLIDVLSQLPIEALVLSSRNEFLKKAKVSRPDLILIDSDRLFKDRTLTELGIPSAIVSPQKEPAAILKARKLGVSDCILSPYNTRELIAHINALLYKKTRITCLGGGTGLFTLLFGLKRIPNLLLTSVVSMSDSGGSSGRLRSSFGILPPGDVRRNLVALSDAPEFMNQVIQHRFKKGKELRDHSFGNLFLTALAEIKGSMAEAVRAMGDVLNIQGIVLPATNTLTDLVARFENSKVVYGEGKIDRAEERHPDLRIMELWHRPEPKCNPDAYASIMFSDYIIIGPGDLYTSVCANLCIPGIRDAIQKTEAKKIYLSNLMTKPGETAHYTAYDHIAEVIKYMGGDYLDYIFLSNTKFSRKPISEYARKDQEPVLATGIDHIQKITKARILVADLANQQELVRHDSEKTRIAIQNLIS